MSAAVPHSYHYAQPSALIARRLHLATSAAPHDEGAEPFVDARVRQPRLVALSMRFVSDIVRSRYHIPAAMLERVLIEADPVLTWGNGVLRIEGFSSCCGMYVRADVAENALQTRALRPGTTNVDFNGEMRAALGRVRDSDQLDLSVGRTGVAVTHDTRRGSRTVVERKVRLPLRWLRGFVEVQRIQQRMAPRFTLDRAGAVRFLRGIPRTGRSSDAAWIVSSGKSIRLGSDARQDGVRTAGPARLRALEPVLPVVNTATVLQDPVTGASAWRFDCGDVVLTTVLSSETWRGFSGEGQVLTQLAQREPKIARVRSMLAWQSELTVSYVAEQAGLPSDEAADAMAWLATQGLVGYDIARDAWFHRVLPFDLEMTRLLLDARNPRLKNARALVDAGAVKVTRSGGTLQAEVKSDHVIHRVQIAPDQDRCTCTWFAKHQGERGPCKHVLAVELVTAQRANS